MTVHDLEGYRQAHAPRCQCCGEPDCPGVHSLLACGRLWADPEIGRIEYANGDGKVLAIDFKRDGLLEMEIDE